MALRRLQLGSLLVVALALAGATVVPSRDITRAHTSITWAAADRLQAETTAHADARALALSGSQTAGAEAPRPRAIRPAALHPLFQRPPPTQASTTHTR